MADKRPEQPAGEPSGHQVSLGPLPGLIGYVMRRAQLAVFQDFMRGFASVDIRPAQYAVLIVIEQNPGLKQSQISTALGIKRANLVPLIDALEERGLATRKSSAGDRRSYALHLTSKGASLMSHLHALRDAHEARVISRIGPGGKAELLRLLGLVFDATATGGGEDDG